MSEAGLRAAEAKMRAARQPEPALASFRHLYGVLEGGGDGLLRDAELAPVGDVEQLEDLPDVVDRTALDRTVVLKLNGGLGTSMGLRQAKSLIEAKDGHSFLDLIVHQVLAARERHGIRLPLVLMHSFATQTDALAALERHPTLPIDVPLDFLQSQEPKLRADDLTPVAWPAAPALEWCPPGHGDVYTSLLASGTLAALRERGYRYAFLSNADNLGAVLEPRLLAWLAREEIPFAMEVVRRTAADRKGGNLARRRADGTLVLRETAQTSPEDLAALADLDRWPCANSNNLWVDLDALAALLEARGGTLALPLVVNAKTVDPTDPGSPAVVQLETAMGAAVGAFAGARAILVPRGRFSPVKTTDDLLALRSDAHVLTHDFQVRLAPEREALPTLVELDPAHYKLLAGFERRFPAGPPSLRGCERLTVRGHVTFGAGVVCRGAVEIDASAAAEAIPDGAIFGG